MKLLEHDIFQTDVIYLMGWVAIYSLISVAVMFSVSTWINLGG